MIKNVVGLAKMVYSAPEGITPKNAENYIERILYKTTDCGAWIKFFNDHIEIGSIVEGVDFIIRFLTMNLIRS